MHAAINIFISLFLFYGLLFVCDMPISINMHACCLHAGIIVAARLTALSLLYIGKITSGFILSVHYSKVSMRATPTFIKSIDIATVLAFVDERCGSLE